MNHTPGPWKAEKTTTRGEFCWNYHVRAQDENMICTIGPCNQDANMQFIVTACNAHEGLVKIAQAYRNHLKASAHTEGEMATYQHISNLLTTIEKGS